MSFRDAFRIAVALTLASPTAELLSRAAADIATHVSLGGGGNRSVYSELETTLVASGSEALATDEQSRTTKLDLLALFVSQAQAATATAADYF